MNMKYDIEKRTFIVEKFHETNRIIKVQRAWRTKYKFQAAPQANEIKNIMSRFEKTGSTSRKSFKRLDMAQKRKIAKNDVENLVSAFPKLSIKLISAECQISSSLTRNILKEDLALKPYKIPEYQKLQPADYQKRVKLAEWFLKLPQKTLEYFIASDEAYFYLTESSNKQNNRIWAAERPSEGIERPLQDEKILVFCAISAVKIYGPYFFSTSVDQHNYLEMLEKWFWPKHLRTLEYKKYYFQQDGAPPHTANIVQKWLASKFGKKFLDKKMWPPRSPDLNPCDFFLWGYLKGKVYNPLPKTIDDLKANIEREIKKINADVLKSTFLNFRKRLKLVIEADGGHIENK